MRASAIDVHPPRAPRLAPSDAAWDFVRKRGAKRRTRITTLPESPAPLIRCPVCHTLLIYRRSILGGLKPPERWDQLECLTCGMFEYRHRTGKVRPVNGNGG